MKKPELLAPAGNMDALKAAILGGCDAIYLGGYMFGARNFANNFDYDELKEAVNYAHEYGVKIYVTTNTLIYENEVERFIKIDRIGSRIGCTYFFKTLSNIYVRCGCFFGTIEQFEQKVNETHKYNEQHRKEYLEAIKYVKAIL